jgi:hypothetical protein
MSLLADDSGCKFITSSPTQSASLFMPSGAFLVYEFDCEELSLCLNYETFIEFLRVALDAGYRQLNLDASLASDYLTLR